MTTLFEKTKILLVYHFFERLKFNCSFDGGECSTFFTLSPTCSILVIHSLPEICLHCTVYYSDVLKIHDKDTNDKPSLQGCANMQVNGCELI